MNKIKKINLKNPIHFLAVGFGAGLIKPAPGTWGSLIGLVVAILLWNLTASSLFFIMLSTSLFIAGCYICRQTSDDLGVHDDGRIVWDEIVAILLMFAFLPEYNMTAYLMAFVSFRFFDIVKPYPIRYFDEKLTTGLGIMFDDLLAAIYALILLHFIYYFI